MILILLCASLTVTQGLNSDPNIDHTMDSASEMFLCVICRIFFCLTNLSTQKVHVCGLWSTFPVVLCVHRQLLSE